jgi:hypothetical protein
MKTSFMSTLMSKKMVAGALVLSVAGGSLAGIGGVAAVDMGAQTVKSIMGARASTSAFTTVTATHSGISVATSAEAGAAAASVTPSTTDASTKVLLNAVNAGDYVYTIKFESTSVDDDIPAGTLNARWLVNGTEYNKSLAVSSATVDVADKGGFTIMVPGTAQYTPDSIQVVFQQ